LALVNLDSSLDDGLDPGRTRWDSADRRDPRRTAVSFSGERGSREGTLGGGERVNAFEVLAEERADRD